VAKYDISDLMTVGIIDCLKMIQVYHDQTGGLARTARTLHLQTQRLIEVAIIE